MRTIVRPAAAAFGLTNLYLLALTGPLISSAHDLVYHLTGAASVIFIPVLVYLLAFWLVWFGAFALAGRIVWLHRVVWSAALLALPWILVETFMGFFGSTVPAWVSALIALASLGLFLAIQFREPLRKMFEAVQPLTETLLVFCAFLGVLILGQLLWFGWQARDLNPAPQLHHSHAVVQPKPRIIWIILDELSYQQVYGQRLPGLQLPAFDQLASESAVFTHVVPAGEYTRNVLPALLTGVPVGRISVSAAGKLLALRDSATHYWVGFDQRNTVFEDALERGYSTGVAGWYIPYCRILPSVLDHCYWMYREDTPDRFSPYETNASNLALPLRALWGRAHHSLGSGINSPSDEQMDIQMHSSDYHDLLVAGDDLLNDTAADFVLLHIPVPHPYGFYDRRSGQIAAHHTSYIDNLALADRYLRRVRSLLEQRDEWDSSTVVIMGDHSWRTKQIWANSDGWTAEDQLASHGGQFDDRPAYIVKLPNEHAGVVVDTRFNAIRTRAMFDEMFKGRVQTPEELETWVSCQR